MIYSIYEKLVYKEKGQKDYYYGYIYLLVNIGNFKL